MNCLSTIRLIFPHPVDTTAEFCIGTEVCCSVPFKGSDVLLEVPPECFTAELPPTIRAAGFCCFLRDIQSAYPVIVEDRGAALPGDDLRSYAEVDQAVRARGLAAEQEKMESEPEITFDDAAPFCRDRKFTPTYLGCGLDVRGFYLEVKSLRNGEGELDLQQWGVVFPRCHSLSNVWDGHELRIQFDLGPGEHARPAITRHLEDGSLPILHSIQHEKNIEYDMTAFAGLETQLLTPENNRGTEHSAAYAFGALSENRLPWQERAAKIASLDRSEEVILRIRVKLRNISQTPAYAFFSGAEAALPSEEFAARPPFEHGMSLIAPDRCAALTLLDGKPVHSVENSVLVWPGEERIVDMLIPNYPLPLDRARKLAQTEFSTHYQAVQKYWNDLLDRMAQVSIPEKGIHDRLRAGLLHLYLATTGEQNGILLPNVGIRYSPIGSESYPIIAAFAEAGLIDEAKRALEFFFERQNQDGSITTYSTYQNEAGPFLWTVGKVYHLCRDREWLAAHLPAIRKSCDYLIKWRRGNMDEAAKLGGYYGLAKGKVDDPVEYFHSFFLNAGSFGGLSRMADILPDIDPEYAAMLTEECRNYRQDILTALEAEEGKAPATPAENGFWVQPPPPWTGMIGDPAYHAEGGRWTYHGAVFYRTLINSDLSCGYYGVDDPRSPLMTRLLRANAWPHSVENAAFCQPYYLRHDYLHLIRGEVKSFLRIFYNQLAAMQDRETYSHWEHYFSIVHKSHEEAWFLKTIFWMLYMADGTAARLGSGIPRAWMKPGQRIAAQGLRTEFGKLDFQILPEQNRCRAEFSFEYPVERVLFRLPDHLERRPVSCTGGEYDPVTETVTVSCNSGKITLEFE